MHMWQSAKAVDFMMCFCTERLKVAMRYISSSSWRIIHDFCHFPFFLVSVKLQRPGIKHAFRSTGLDYCLGRGRPLGPPRRALAVDSQVRCEAAQHHLQVKPLPLQLDALLGHGAGLPPQLALHLSHPPHVVVGHVTARPGAQVSPAGRRERHRGRSLGLRTRG